MSDNIVLQYLDMLEAQRETAFIVLRKLPEEALWHRPAPNSWCVGENLDHNVAVLRSFWHFFQFIWPAASLIGRARRNHPYLSEIDDVYARPEFPLGVGWMWSPKVSPQKQVSLQQLYELTVAEHESTRRFYISKPTEILGNSPLYDPAIGKMNFIQALRVGVYHDQHHYVNIGRILRETGYDFPVG